MIKLICDVCGTTKVETFHTGTIESQFVCDACTNKTTFTDIDWIRVITEGINFKAEYKELNSNIISYFSGEIYEYIYDVDCLSDLSEDSLSDFANFLATLGPDRFNSIKEDDSEAEKLYDGQEYKDFNKNEKDLFSELTL